MGTPPVKTPLHSSKPLRRRFFNRVFAFIYALAIIALLYHDTKNLLYATTWSSFFIFSLMLLSNTILAFMWLNSQAFRMNPVIKQVFPDNLKKVLDRKDFPTLDIFICTADPDKEPPMSVAATALSVLGYDYPTEKLSVYVSDDGGSELTLFALMEAAEFAKSWLPFCRENNVLERCPDAFFQSNYALDSDCKKVKILYENMKTRVENADVRGKVSDEYKYNEQAAEAFIKWNGEFTRQDHPAVVQVLSQPGHDKDLSGHSMPGLVYVSREKCKAYHHNFKAGALNALLRVSALLTNAQIVLTLDCDMISNDPSTPQKMLCYFMEDSCKPNLGYVQFPQRFDRLNKADIYGSELKRMFHINPMGLNGLSGPDYFGTGTFFRRRIFFGEPSSYIQPELPELGPDHVVEKAVKDQKVLELSHHVASCNYESQTNWGTKIGFRYGSLVEDFYTGYRFHSEGWKSIFCNPERPAFLCDTPISLNESLVQTKRWDVGLLEVALSKHSPFIFGIKSFGPLMAHCYAYYCFGPILSFPIMVYSFLPQVTLLNNISIFSKVRYPWFLLYIFLFHGAYGADFIDFILAQGTILRWWSDQRMWLIRGLSSNLFGSLEYFGNHLGISSRGFDVTSKLVDNEQRKRYDEGKFEFGVASPMFLPFSVAAILNVTSLIWGFVELVRKGTLEEYFAQVFIAMFGVLNCLPIYEAMIFRNDNGRMPTKITMISIFVALALYVISSFILKM